MERKTLTEWPTSPLQDAIEWWLYMAAPDYVGIPGRFRYDDHGRIVFECEDGTALGAGTFEDGERFEPCEAPNPDPRDARIAALEGEVLRLNEALNSIKLDRESSDVTWCPQCGPHVIVDDEGLCEMCGATSVGAGAARAVALSEENAALEGRLRETCQILVESVGGLGPCNAEDAARRAAEVVDQLRAQLAAPPVIDRIAMRDAIADALGSSAYDCARVWSAWSYGTMGQDDFRPVVDDEDRLMEIVDAVVDAIASRQPCGVGVKS